MEADLAEVGKKRNPDHDFPPSFMSAKNNKLWKNTPKTTQIIVNTKQFSSRKLSVHSPHMVSEATSQYKFQMQEHQGIIQ